jgi:hypothetical protein
LAATWTQGGIQARWHTANFHHATLPTVTRALLLVGVLAVGGVTVGVVGSDAIGVGLLFLLTIATLFISAGCYFIISF